MSLHTIVQGGVAARLNRRRDVRAHAAVATRAMPLSTRVSISSMRLLETGLAVGAIAAAIFIGQGR